MQRLGIVCRIGRVFFVAGVFLCLQARTSSSQTDDTAQTSSRTISAVQFMQSSFGSFFNTGDYDAAFDAINSLLDEYPNDPLLWRYKAMTLSQLGQTKEAIAIYTKLLKKDSDHVPTHYFLGEALFYAGEKDQAASEWKGVVESAAGSPYAEWAGAALKDLASNAPPERQIRRWRIAARYGYDYDTNVTLKPRDDSLAASGDESAGRHSASLNVRYLAYVKKDLTVELEYQTSQSFHDDSLNEFNFHAEEWGINARKKVKIRNKDVVLGSQYQFLMGILDTSLFTVTNRWVMSADTRLTKYSRTILHNQLSVSNFGPDGFNPSQTSRDGGYNDTGFTHYWYTKDFKRYVFLREEINVAQARGGNFDAVGNSNRIGFHTPLAGKLSLDTSAGLQFMHYPNFTSLSSADTSDRRDLDWDLYTALTYQIKPNIALRGIYRYIRALNQNNFFDYSRHILGGEVVFAEAF